MKSKKQNTGVALLWALSLSALLAGCNDKTDSSTSTGAPANANPGTNASTAADNTGVNARDRNNATLTPGDQGNSPADRDLTQKIRQALVSGTNNVSGTNDFSMTAKNIKIITADGKVTLRGPVNTADEKTAVETIARNVAGNANVDDQLEVKANQ